MATFWGWAIVACGALGLLLYSALVYRARARITIWQYLVGIGIALVCGYSAVVWGGQMLGVFVLTAEIGRPALGLALLALVWMALLAFSPRAGE